MANLFKTVALMGIILLGTPFNGYGDSAAKLVAKGNAAYLAEDYDQALSAYEEASIEAPESPHIYFNRGTVFYQKGDYAAATEAFEKAALKSKDISLEAKSRFNLGNCAYQEAERQQDSDLNKALEACTKSIQHFQEALDLSPDFKEAAENMEVVRLVMKNILDEINKQKEAAKQQQEAMNEARDQLKALIQKQQKALDRNQILEDEREKKGETQPWQEQTQDLAQDQKDLQAETEELAKNMPKPGKQTPQQGESPVETHLNNAATEMTAASGNLENYHTQEAGPNQKKAIQELNDALESLEKGQKGQGQQQEQQPEGDQQGQQQQAQPPGEPQQDEPSPGQNDQEGNDQKEDQAVAAQASEDAGDILNEEKENQKKRRTRASGGYRDVDRDW